jgi:hypothetical protein
MEFGLGWLAVELNNRELAAGFWLVLVLTPALTWLLWRRDTRSSLIGIALLAFHPAILVPSSLMASYVAMLAWLASQVTLWHPSLAKETVLWFLGTAVVLLFKATELEKDPGYLRTRWQAVVAWTVALTFIVNLVVLPLPVEFVLQPWIMLLVLILITAERDPAYQTINRAAEWLLAATVLGLLTYSSIHVLTHWGETNRLEVMRSFLLPIWLTVGLLPFIFVLAVGFAYESAFRRIRMFSKSRSKTLRALLALLAQPVLRPHELAAFHGYWARELGESPSLTGARAVIARLREHRDEQERERNEREARVRRYAGVEGTDDKGLRLDQREFEETMTALRRLWGYQMGWYRNRGERYQAEPFSFFIDELEKAGLSAGESIKHGLSKSGRSWWASRRTVTGWVFAIGAKAPPPDQWIFEGPEHPRGIPGEDEGWRAAWDTAGTHW